MKVLSIRQPWAARIVEGLKDIENRTWATDYRGPLLIHASGTPDRVSLGDLAARVAIEADELRGRLAIVHHRGGIVGIVHVVERVTAHSSPWFTGPWGWVLRDARQLPFCPMPGRLRLFEAATRSSSTCGGGVERARDRLAGTPGNRASGHLRRLRGLLRGCLGKSGLASGVPTI